MTDKLIGVEYSTDHLGIMAEYAYKPRHKAWDKDLALTARVDISDFWAFKIEGHFMNGTRTILFVDNPDGIQEDSFLLALKSTYHF